MLYGPEGSANEVLQGYREMGADAGKGQIYSEGSGDDRAAFWQLTLNNDIKLNLGRGRYDETFGSLCRTLSGFYSSRRKPMANGLATLICVMTLERQ